MGEYRKFFDPLIKSVEGHSDDVYADQKGNATVGTGLNLEDGTVQGLMKMHGYDPEEVKSGKRQIASDDLNSIHNSYLDDRERLVKGKMGPDLYETLQPHEKAAMMSMGYQSLNNLGPTLTGAIASGDKLAAMREMILNTNKDKDPGVLRRRMEEAQLYGGPLDFTSTFKVMSPEEKKQLTSIIEKTQNENTRQELMDKYGSYLNDAPEKQQFTKLFSKIAGK